ncbi:MAG TPA: biotin-dependent carboxyltransferase family protein [Thermoanaerobaculia bacterium]|nr:biotin-dependent carboxyltransferase family protein [Thermoanaerobaculia bacterium]
MRRGLVVLEPGILSTVQDLGRPGWGAWGVPASGALDEEALRLANRLVGNPEDAAALEITLSGPVFKAVGDVLLAVVGGPFGPAPGEVMPIHDGGTLALTAGPGAVRAVVAVAGGIDVPQVLGSRSTCVSARFGGFQGRRLQKGDVLAIGEPFGRPLPGRANVPRPPAGDVTLRAMPGPQEDLFDPEARAAFWASTWRVLPESNRMGIRLRGASLGFVETAALPSEGTAPGAVQITAEGQPIVLLAERPTTGGYPKIATVASVDLGLLARTAPGRNVRFERISVDEARRLLAERETSGRAGSAR